KPGAGRPSTWKSTAASRPTTSPTSAPPGRMRSWRVRPFSAGRITRAWLPNCATASPGAMPGGARRRAGMRNSPPGGPALLRDNDETMTPAWGTRTRPGNWTIHPAADPARPLSPARDTMHFPGSLFDLDGTLLDTIPDLADAANAMRQDMGLAPLAQDIIATYVGKGVEQLVIRTLGHEGPPASVDMVMRGLARYQDHYRALNGQRSRLYPGVLAGLEAFREQGARLA